MAGTRQQSSEVTKKHQATPAALSVPCMLPRIHARGWGALTANVSLPIVYTQIYAKPFSNLVIKPP